MPIFLDPVAPEHRRRVRVRRQRRLVIGVIWVGALVAVAGAVHAGVAEVAGAAVAAALAILAIVLIAASGGVHRRDRRRR